MAIADLLSRVNAEKQAQRTALIAKGVDMNDAPFEDYHSKIASITGGGSPAPADDYVRPADRPPVPTLNPNEVYILFGVSEASPNDYAINVTCVGGYTVDWGDGTTDNWARAATCAHQYDYAAVSGTPDSRGYKLVWIKITPQGANPITAMNLVVRPSARPPAASAGVFIPQALEMYVNTPSLTAMTWATGQQPSTRYKMLEIFSYTGAQLVNATYFLMDCLSLRAFDGAEHISPSAYFMNNCYSYNQPFPEGVTFANVTIYFMNYCYSYNQPFPEGVTFANVTTYFMNYCNSYNQPFPEGVTFANVTTYFMLQCYSYNQPFPEGVTFANVTTYFMNYCYSYNQPFPEGVTFANVTTYFMLQCSSYNHETTIHLQNTTAIGTASPGVYNYAQKGLRLIGMGAVHNAITISNSSLDRDALVALFGDLYDRSATTVGTLTIVNCYGVPKLSAEDRAIATNKNWTLVT